MNDNNLTGNSDDQSVFNPINDNTKYLLELKKSYENALAFPLQNNDNRKRVLNLAMTLNDNLNGTILKNSPFERNQLYVKIKSLISMNKILQKVVNDFLIESFESSGHRYSEIISEVFQNHNLGIKTKHTKNVDLAYCDALNIDDRMNNPMGIPISFEMNNFCAKLYQRALNKFDNIVCIEGPTGMGKTSFAIAMLTTYSTQYSKLGWDWNKNLVIAEAKENVSKRLETLEPFQVLQLDEAGNIANKRQWFDSSQQDFLNLITRIRFHNLTMAVLWPNMNKIEKDLASERGIISISINERGKAVAKSYNKNPHSKDKTYVPKAATQRFARSSSEAQEITKTYDMSVLGEIPFYEIPDNIWTVYEQFKEASLSVINIRKNKTKDELRERTKSMILKLLEEGKSQRQIAKRLGVSQAHVSHIIRDHLLSQLSNKEPKANKTIADNNTSGNISDNGVI